MKFKQTITVTGAIQLISTKTAEIFWIREVEKNWFSVTSSRNLDSYGNGLAFDDIRKAFKYIYI